MDNAGENLALASKLKQKGISVEFTAPNTPQQNGVIERGFATLMSRGRAMMAHAGFTNAMKGKLWAECMNTATKLDNLMPYRAGAKMTRHKQFYGEGTKYQEELHIFAKIGFQANREKIKAKLEDRGEKVLFLGYADDHEGCFFAFIGYKLAQLS